MENEAELAEFMQSIGFTCVEPQLLSAEDQIAMFGGAHHIAGLGGAGMFNAVFCRKHAKLLDIESTAAFLDDHSSMFSSIGLNYGVIVGAESPDDTRPVTRRGVWICQKHEPRSRTFFDNSVLIGRRPLVGWPPAGHFTAPWDDLPRA